MEASGSAELAKAALYSFSFVDFVNGVFFNDSPAGLALGGSATLGFFLCRGVLEKLTLASGERLSNVDGKISVNGVLGLCFTSLS